MATIKSGVLIYLLAIMIGYFALNEALYKEDSSIIRKIFAGLITFMCLIIAVIMFDISGRYMSQSHSYKTLFDQYLAMHGLNIVGFFMWHKLLRDIQRSKQVQDEFLLNQIQRNVKTDYGKSYKFDKIKSREDFVHLHPLTRYEHFEKYIDRIAKGEGNVLCVELPIVLGVTSGTSGRSTMLPTLKRQTTVFFFYGIAVLYYCLVKCYPSAKSLQKSLKIFFTPNWRISEGGIRIGPNSSSPGNSSSHLLSLYSTPLPAYRIMSEPEALYVHLLFALKDRNLGTIEANFASLIYTAFVMLKHRWKCLVQDIRCGRLNPELNIDSDIRIELNALLKPDSLRSNELSQEFEKGFHGIAKRIWPYCNLILTVETGSFDLYGRLLREQYTNGIPTYSPIYAATEGLIGLNIWPESEKAYYLLTPRAQFYEFIPIQDTDEEQPKTLFIDQVKIGETYELVITNVSGLYRYRFGDVVRILSFHSQCPVIEFLFRQGQLLNVRGEKTSERTFYQALLKTVLLWSHLTLVDYCCAESALVDNKRDNITDLAPYYVVFMELEYKKEAMNLTEDEKMTLDQTLCEESFVYRSFRNKGSIGPMDVHIVRPGTFLELRNFLLLHSNASANQIKIPRVLRLLEAVHFLIERIIN